MCVCEHLWLQSGLVCGCMSLSSCARKVWEKGGKAWRNQIKKNKNLAVVSCVFSSFFHCEWCGVLWFRRLWVRVVCSWSVDVCSYVGAKWLGGWCVFACM